MYDYNSPKQAPPPPAKQKQIGGLLLRLYSVGLTIIVANHMKGTPISSSYFDAFLHIWTSLDIMGSDNRLAENKSHVFWMDLVLTWMIDGPGRSLF